MDERDKLTRLAEMEQVPKELEQSAALLKKAALYKPPEGAKHRVWRNLVERKNAFAGDWSASRYLFSPRRIAYLSAVAACAFLIFFFYRSTQEIDKSMHLTTSEENIIFTHSGEERLFQPNEFVKIFAHPNTKALLAERGNDGLIKIALNFGALSVYVIPDRNQRFSVYTLRGDYSVLGTSFYISADEKVGDMLAVYSGRVKIVTAEKIAVASAGSCASINRALSISLCSELRSEDSGVWGAVPQFPHPALAIPFVPAVESEKATTALPPGQTYKPQRGDDEKTDEPSPRTSIEKKDGERKKSGEGGSIVAKDTREAEKSELPELDKWLALQTKMITMPPSQRLIEIKGFLAADPHNARRSEVLAALADAYKGVNKPKEAFEIYEKLYELNKGGLWRESALYEMGFIAFYSLNDPRGAIKYFSEQRRNFPHGSLKEEADFHIVKAQIAIGRYSEARMNLENFTRSYVGSPQRPAALYMLATIYREHENDCKRALEAYESFLAVTTEKTVMREEALYWRAGCLELIGDALRARSAYSDYLNRYPEGKYAKNARAKLEKEGDE
ncbi:MAG: hypothetical protein Kow0090_13810 [Myxococcota bacterium]